MSAKIGRPKIDKPKEFTLRARLDEETNEKVNNYCKEYKINRSEFLRKAIEKVLQKK